MNFDEINKKIEENQAEMISSLSNLISVPSVAQDVLGREPFGENVQKAYKQLMDLAEKEGFRVYNADNYGGHIDFPGKGEGVVGILGHLDVVPEGDNWDFDPYGGQVIDGYLCGRGTVDDKGPVMAAFYAMKALKDSGYEPEKTIRLIVGLDEETDWKGMDYYLSRVGDDLPTCGFTPDGNFPVIHAEMGIIVFDICRKIGGSRGKGLELSSVQGGTAANSVADFARAVVRDTTGSGYDLIKEMVANIRSEKGWKINCKGVGKSLEITIRGTSAHGAQPEKGLNAISLMMEFLGGLNLLNDDVNDFIRFYNECIGYDLHGERIGCNISDEASGPLIFNVGMVDITKDTAKLTINIRYPVTSYAEDVYDGIMEVIGSRNLGIVKGKDMRPLYVPADSPLIETLMGVYRKHTGDEESQPLVIGGGTYARAMDNIVAFGGCFPGEPELEHQRNEKISLENLKKLTQIYAEAVYELSRA